MPEFSLEEPGVLERAISRTGGRPNMRAYSRLNCDVLVNNAGIAVFEMVADLTEDAFHKQFNVKSSTSARS